MGEVRFTAGSWQSFLQSLHSNLSVETKIFALCRVISLGNRTVFLVREIVNVPDEAYEFRTSTLIQVSGEFVLQLLERCLHEGYSLLEAHTHPWTDRPYFSSVDNASDPQKFRATSELLPTPPFRHASLVLGNDVYFSGRYWDYERETMVPIRKIRILSNPIREVYGTDVEEVVDLTEAQQALYDRQIRAFGSEGQYLLKELTVGVVGAGGLGSIIASQLAYLGVGRVLLFDPDRLELSNLNRVIGACYEQAVQQKPKVEALADFLNQVRPDNESVIPHPLDARSEDALAHLAQCDIIVGAVDSAATRLYLNLVSSCLLIPYLDAGVGILTEAGRAVGAGGQVHTIVPGTTACLECLGRFKKEAAQEELRPDQREMAIRAGYIQGEPVPNPQVIFLNGVVGSLLVCEFMKLATGYSPAHPYIYYDMLQQVVVPVEVERRDDCWVCSQQALGLEAVQDYVQPRHRESRPIPPPLPIEETSPETFLQQEEEETS